MAKTLKPKEDSNLIGQYSNNDRLHGVNDTNKYPETQAFLQSKFAGGPATPPKPSKSFDDVSDAITDNKSDVHTETEKQSAADAKTNRSAVDAVIAKTKSIEDSIPDGPSDDFEK